MSLRTLALLVVTACPLVLGLSGCGRASKPSSPDLPTITVNLPKRGIKVGQQFPITVSLPKNDKVRQVHMDASDPFTYEPADFELQPGQQQVVHAALQQHLDSGLAEINISAEGYEPYLYVVDTGFSGKLKVQVPSELKSRGRYPVSVQVLDDKEQPQRLDSAASLHVSAINGVFITDTVSESIDVNLAAGSSSTQPWTVKPTSIAGEPMVLVMQLRPYNSDVSIAEQRADFPVLPAWWYTLGLAMLGGCVPPIYRFAAALADGGGMSRVICYRGGAKLLTGAVAGVVAFLFAAWDIIGVKLDQSSSRTFLILGFLFAYVGVDVLLKRVLGQTGSKDESSDDDDHQPEAKPEPPAAQAANAG